MQDRVAEVLLERQALDSSATPGIVLSLALHAFLAGLFLFPFRMNDAPTKRTVISMRLAPSGSQRSFAERKTTTRGASKTVRSATPAPSMKPVTTKAPDKTLGKVDPARSNEKTLFGMSKVPAAASPGPVGSQNEVTPSNSGPSAGFAVPGIGSAGVTGLEGGDFPYDAYIDRMISLVGRNWFRPQTSGEPLATVYFIVERNGTVRDVKIEKASGNAAYDRAAFRAIREASPLPPLPFAYSGTHLGVHLTFH